MTLPSSGPITMAMIAAELNISASGLSLNDSRVRALAGKTSGAISFADLRGKTSLIIRLVSSSPSANGPGGTTAVIIVEIGNGFTTSGAVVSGSSAYVNIRKVSHTRYEFYNNYRPFNSSFTYRITATNGIVSGYVDATVVMNNPR